MLSMPQYLAKITSMKIAFGLINLDRWINYIKLIISLLKSHFNHFFSSRVTLVLQNFLGINELEDL